MGVLVEQRQPRLAIDQHLESMQQLAKKHGLEHAQQSMCGFLALALITTISNNDGDATADNQHHNDEDAVVQNATLSRQSSSNSVSQ